MKTILTHLGKSIAVILYWVLVALFIWLFYDDYITEQQWSSICMCIAVFSLGCAFYGLFINWLYKAELKRFECKHSKAYDIIGKIVDIASTVFLGIVVVSSFLGLLGEFYFTFIYGIYLIVCEFWEYWFIVILLFMAYILLTAFKQPIIKIVSKFIYRASLLSTIALVVYIEIVSWNHIDTETFMGNYLLGGCIVLLFLFGVLCFLLFNSLRRGVLSFAKLRYVLFLRAFKDDDSVQYIYNDISQSINDIPLVKIGNPKKTESQNVNEHWLPFSNWKFFLKFYISRAKAIIIFASSTDGIIWEMMQNMRYLNKCIIAYTSLDELLGFKNRLIENGSCDVIIYAIEKVIKNCHKKENAFVIQSDKIYIGEVCALINYMLKNDFDGIQVISETNTTSIGTRLKQKNLISSIDDFLFRHFHVLNFVNTIEAIHNNSLRMIIKGFAFVVGASFYIIQFLFGIGMILGSLLIWFGDNVDWLKDVNYENIGITEKVLMTCFGILVGKNCIKNLFGKD